ncbi:MAG: radical SAM protein [candidate division KSB1 bacterium]|nr:radical SAM protein [candidate division KSB1 bacterium]
MTAGGRPRILTPSPIAVRELCCKSALTPSRIPGIDYALNPYVGCAHGCRYCYADFMRRFTGHSEAWGTFVDVRVNAPQKLAKELERTKPGVVSLSTVTDPYQPLEARYRLTRACLEILARWPFQVSILTKSPLVTRDIDVLRSIEECEVGLTITTDDEHEQVRRLFEPRAPNIAARLNALSRLKKAGLTTYAFVGPALPMNPHRLASLLQGLVDEVLVDRMNYAHKVVSIYRRHGLMRFLSEEYFAEVQEALSGVGVW